MPDQRGWIIVRPSSNLLRKLRLRHFGKSDEGQALVIAGLAMVSLLLMAGLGVDVGYLHYQKQQMQKAADSGALAAASALVYSGNYVAAATNDTKANGFTADQIVTGGLCSPSGTNICVAVNSPPMTPGDPFQGVAGYVEVIVSQPRPTFFMKVAGMGSVNVASRAVATTTSTGSGCVFVMDHSDADALEIHGNVAIASSCGIYVDSNSDNAIEKTGTAGSVSASYIGVVGTDQIKGNFQFDCTSGLPSAGCPSTGIAQFQDPLANVQSPTPQACGSGQQIGNTFYPGAYCSGISLKGNGTYTFEPGQYTIMNGINVTGTPTLNGSGVLFYLTGNATNPYGGVNIGGNATVSLTAETSGPQAGILFFQDRNICNPASLSCAQSKANSSTFSGNSGNSFSGAFYFPSTALTYSGTPNLSNAAVLVAYTLEFNGNAQLNNKALVGIPSLNTALLVE